MNILIFQGGVTECHAFVFSFICFCAVITEAVPICAWYCFCIDIVMLLAYNKKEVIVLASINMSIRTDSELKAQAEAVLSQLGMNMNGTINMFLHQIVRDKAVPLSLSLSSEQAVYADLLAAQSERRQGVEGRNARDVLADMDRIIAETGGVDE